MGPSVFSLLVLLSCAVVDSKWPQWMDVSPTIDTLGNLCDTESDLIGTKLGCDCRYPVMTPGRNLVADCSSQTLGSVNMELPSRINVSLHVRRLLFNDNFLTSLNPDTFSRTEGVLEATFARNRLTTFEGLALPRLAELDLSYNQIQNLSLTAFKGLTKLEVLDLSFNLLKVVDSDTFSGLMYLRVLNLGSNLIGLEADIEDEYPFTLEHLTRLEELDLSNNTLQDFPTSILEGSENVKRLNLRNNRILHLAPGEFLTLKHLEVIDLSGNLLNVIHPNAFQGLSSLRSLVVDGNSDLVLIEEHGFAGMPALKELSLQRNHRLVAIERRAFKGDVSAQTNDTSPTTVRLGDNSLTFLDEDLLDWKNLQYLDLVRNPWVCDCNLQWVATFRLEDSAQAAILIDPDFKCLTPEHLKDTAVATLNPSELMCYSPVATTIGIVAVVLFCLILLTFCTIVALNAYGLLPKSFRNLNVFGQFNSLPKYMRVRARSTGSCASEPHPPDLEWDNADVGDR